MSQLAEFQSFIEEKARSNGSGGRPSFISILAKTHPDLTEVLLTICEAAWIKEKPPRLIAPQYHTSYLTIYRLLQDLEPFKEKIVEYLKTEPRRKRFYNKELDTSDYLTVQNYIIRAKRDGLKTYKAAILNAQVIWRMLNYKDPANWTIDEVLEAMQKLSPGYRFNMAICIRRIAPQLAQKGSLNELKVGRFSIHLKQRKKDIFAKELNLIREALIGKKMSYHLVIFLLHVATGAREGCYQTADKRSGLCGFTWDRFKDHFTKVDLFESKVKGGIWSRDCPLGLLFKDLPSMLEALWKERGKPIDTKVIPDGYGELLHIYRDINAAVAEYFEGKLEPGLYKELTTLQPHSADKIHCNLLWEAGVPLEVVAGRYLGGTEAIGLVGRIWLNIETIKKHYLALTARSQRFQKILARVQEYSKNFDAGQAPVQEVAIA